MAKVKSCCPSKYHEEISDRCNLPVRVNEHQVNQGQSRCDRCHHNYIQENLKSLIRFTGAFWPHVILKIKIYIARY